MSEKICVIGLGYVGLPLAVELAKHHDTVGFDINAERVRELQSGVDRTLEVENEELKRSQLKVSDQLEDLKDRTFFIVTVPTPIDENNNPDLTPLRKASEMLGKVVKEGAVVVYESTVYPGVTEEYCGPILSQVSGLELFSQIKLGYSPERINPGDKVHTITKVTKVVAAQDAETLDRVASVYESVVTAGVFRAASIKVAEAAKVIENTQRDLNIALMNELAMIFDRLGIRTVDVLEAAGTKWNFLKFSPGLVGGHCIGVDPYYLTQKAEQVGYHPQVILSGRRVNDNMGSYVAQKVVKLLIKEGRNVKGARVGVLGLTFKENVPDLRNSKVPDIVRELKEFGMDVIIHDPYADVQEAQHEYNLTPVELEQFHDLDAVVVAVCHTFYKDLGFENIISRLKPQGVVADIKSLFIKEPERSDLTYWSL
ncbi:nucleotide sugar dehydrogenase [Deinococcus roseus]|uniref:UDP-N-acetyl-D-galactosamine dehydrogenase n=1 Tax=Deinococcus roseus TaxID=392414 RepID=A0ABQ2CWY0_9DEIO|nr:nucleotide sugar dehydrogenase [Deinococcus roseus]GGJ24928.1 UDP-N-acetyl-D-galactosamine dehydrogenase [Deinococcus roseus]